jgi:dolichyldiphosphatase
MTEPQWKPFMLTHITYPANESLYAPILALLSLLPPFGVCALTAATVIYKDVIAAYLLIGSLLSAVLSAILKRVIQEPRPDRYDDDEDDIEFGMPSNHSCFAWFCCTFVMIYVVRRGGLWASTKLPSRCCSTGMNITELPTNKVLHLTKLWNFLHTSFTIILALFIAIGCSCSRVYLQYHSPAQVYAGSVLGIILGAFWYHLFQTNVTRDLLVLVDGIVYELECLRRQTTTYCHHENGKRD